MRIIIPEQADETDGVYTYIDDLVKVLRDSDHYVYNPKKHVDDKYDIGFLKTPYSYDFPTIIHEHQAIIPSLRFDMYKGWLKKGRVVTVNSEYQRNQLIKKGIDGSKIRWLPNCVDEDMFYPRDTIVMTKKILYLGRAGQNNQNTFLPLIEAMKGLPDFSLTVAGSVDNYIRKKIDTNNITNVSFLGDVPDKNILAEIISMHSFGVGVGRSAMEMLLCGLPVMVFGLGWEGWVTERNVESLHRQANMTSRMAEEISVEEKVERIRSAIYSAVPISREKAVEVFGLRKNLHIYESLFKELINETLQDNISGSDSSVGIPRV